MHNINDDIDELMRRAAEDYPLKTDSSDWDKVFSALNSETPSAPPSPKGNRNYRFLSLLLLLLVPFACNYFLGKPNGKTAPSSIVQENASSISRPTESKKNQQEPTIQETAINQKQHAKIDPQVPLTPVASVKETKSANPGSLSPKQESHTSANEVKPATPVSSGKATRKATEIAVSKSQSQKERSSFKEQRETPGLVSAATDNFSTVKDNAAPVKNSGTAEHATSDSTALATTHTAEKTDTVTAQPITQESAKQATHKKPEQALYLSVVAGADGSTIKLQSVKAGYNIGIIAGYQFHKKWMVEAGAFWSKKSYYSDAEYFNTSKVYIPANTKLKTVEGDCHMIEVPIDIRYNFNSTERRTWFSTLGLSSYIMKKEDYDYTYEGQTSSYDYYKTYKNATTNLVSVAYFSMGVQQKIGNTISLRVEPYLKMPLKGLGIGSLPITSAGLNVGFTKRIF